MNGKKLLPLFVIATMLLPAISIFAAPAMSIELSSYNGYVGDKVVATGTTVTNNGQYVFVIDVDKDGVLPVTGLVYLPDPNDALLGPYTSTAYAFSKEITWPDSYQGGIQVWIVDISSGYYQQASTFFTVNTKYSVSAVSGGAVSGIQLEGGPYTITGTISGGTLAMAGAVDLRVRIKNPTAGDAVTTAYVSNIAASAAGKYSAVFTVGVPPDINLETSGVYTVLLDWDLTATIPAANAGVASTTFKIRMTNREEYDRMQSLTVGFFVKAGTTVDKWELVDPTGAIKATDGTDIVGLTYVGPATIYTFTKTDALGTWTLKLLKADASIYKSVTFIVNKATITPTIVNYVESSTLEGGAAIAADNQAVKRMHTLEAWITLTYPDASSLIPADVPDGWAVNFLANSTLIKTIQLDPLTAYNAGIWTVKYAIPKDLTAGKGYVFNVTAASIVDTVGNVGPAKNYGSASISRKVKVTAGTLFVGAAPNLIYPGAGNTLSRTLTAKATFDVRYADNSRFTGAELSKGNVTATALGTDYPVALLAADYNADSSLWIAKWKIAYNAGLGAGSFKVVANNLVDTWGNKGPTAPTAPSGAYIVGPAAITISDMAISNTAVQSDEQVDVTFKAAYPSGDPVTTRYTGYPYVEFSKGGTVISTVRAGYSAGEWIASYIIPSGSISGTYNATIKAYGVGTGFADNADATTLANCNTGPTTKKFVNFEVSRVSLTDVFNAANDAKASAVLAQTKSDAAKLAADNAGVKADAAAAAAADAKTAALSAGTKADAAVTAANAAGTAATSAGTAATAAKASADAAKTAADAAKAAADAAGIKTDGISSKVDNLQTLVYGAIGAALIAAIASIVGLMTVSRKIA